VVFENRDLIAVLARKHPQDYDEAAKELKLQHSMCEFRLAKHQTLLSPTEFSGSRPLQIGKSPRPSFTSVAVSSAVAQKPRMEISV